MIRPFAIFACLGCLLMVPFERSQLRADLVFVSNPSFEDITGESPYNEFTFGPFTGWNLYDPTNITNGGAGPNFWLGTLRPTAPVYFTNGASDGQRVAIAFNSNSSGNLGEYGYQQTLAATLQANSTYSLSVDIGNISSGTTIDGTFFNLNGFPGYRVDLLAGGQVIAQDNNTLAGSIPEGAFRTSNLVFSTGANHALLNQALSIRLVNLNRIDASDPTADWEVDFDNVRLNLTSVPEPSSLCLGLIACCAIARRIQRKRVNAVT